MSSPRSQITFMIVAAALILVASRVYRATRPPSPSEQLAPLREELALFRAAAASCNDAYAVTEADFRLYEARVDSLRQAVRHYEALDPNGVPGEEYPEYLETFDAYNEAVPEWEARTDALEAQRDRCRSLTEQHNALADSARGRLIDLGRWPDDTLGFPSAPSEGDPDRR
jgi:hypothetical protein